MNEAGWLVALMNDAGLSNQRLAAHLAATTGWTGGVNNVSHWRTGLVRLPADLLPEVLRAAGHDPTQGEGLRLGLQWLAARHPALLPFLKAPPEAAAAAPAEGPRLPHYIGRRGRYQGQRHVPARTAAGQYIAARSRFDGDQRHFDTPAALLAALRQDPELRLRMVPEANPRASPSLIHQASLSWS